MGTTRSAISRLESAGKHGPVACNAQALCKRCRVPSSSQSCAPERNVKPNVALPYAWTFRVRLTVKFWGVLVFASFVTLARADEAPVDAFKEGIEGIYVLQELQRNGEIFRPPVVDARFVLLNGRFVFISHDRTKEPNKTTVAGYGVYVLEAGTFSYRYEGFSVITQTADGTSVSENNPWEGLRTFAASVESNEIRYRAINGPQEYVFNADGMSYSDGKQMRVYRRETLK